MRGRGLSGYVQRESDDCRKCGRLEHGFVRLRCELCHVEQLVAFSCKRRGFCPSCGARHMVESAALLVDQVLPEQSMRQWVLSFPYPLRFMFAGRRSDRGRGSSAGTPSAVCFHRPQTAESVFSLAPQARCVLLDCLQIVERGLRGGAPRGRAGFILFGQAFGDPVTCHPPNHALVADGAFSGSGTVRFFHRFPQVCWQYSCAGPYWITWLKTRRSPRHTRASSGP